MLSQRTLVEILSNASMFGKFLNCHRSPYIYIDWLTNSRSALNVYESWRSLLADPLTIHVYILTIAVLATSKQCSTPVYATVYAIMVRNWLAIFHTREYLYQSHLNKNTYSNPTTATIALQWANIISASNPKVQPYNNHICCSHVNNLSV